MGTTISLMFVMLAWLMAMALLAWKAAVETRKEAMWRLDIAVSLVKMANIALHEAMSAKAGKPVQILSDEDYDELRRRVYESPSMAASVSKMLDDTIARYGVEVRSDKVE